MMIKSILRCFIKRNAGAVAIEFAMVAGPLFALMLGIIEAGYDLYMQGALDSAAHEAARQILTGAVQNTSVNGAAADQSYFIKSFVCSKLPGNFACSNVVVNISDFAKTATPTPYYNYVNAAKTGLIEPPLDNTQTSYCMGSTSAYVVLQILYPLPVFTGLFARGAVQTYQGHTVRVLMATAVFRNEPFPTPANAGC